MMAYLVVRVIPFCVMTTPGSGSSSVVFRNSIQWKLIYMAL